MRWIVGIALSLAGVEAYASYPVYVEAHATSDVAEYIAVHQADARAREQARQKCLEAGYNETPEKIPGRVWTTASYRHRLWVAKVFGDFDCEPDPANVVGVHGPWPSEDGALNFVLIDRRVSWWQAQAICRDFGYRLASWMDIAKSWQYLNGTSNISQLMSAQNGCASLCPSYSWTADERSAELAYLFATVSPNRRDPRGMGKDARQSGICVF